MRLGTHVGLQDGISGGQTKVTGQFTEQQAKALANLLEFGALPVRVQVQSKTTGY
jgi:SecD/SecF fusion protein